MGNRLPWLVVLCLGGFILVGLSSAGELPGGRTSVSSQKTEEECMLYVGQDVKPPSPSYLSSILRFFGLSRNVHDISKVAFICVHGWSASYGVSVPISGGGQLTAEHMCERVERNFKDTLDEAGVSSDGIDVTHLAYETFGKVEARAESIVKSITDDASKVTSLKNADTVILVAHSQGSPVSVLLLSQLLKSSMVQRGARLGLLTMAGVHHGASPTVAEYGTGEVRELLALGDSQSEISKAYQRGVSYILTSGARVAAFASAEDSVVNLVSSTMDHVSSPQVLRGVYGAARMFDSSARGFHNKLQRLAVTLRNDASRGQSGVLKDIGLARFLGNSPNIIAVDAHSDIHGCDVVYKKGLNWILQAPAGPVHIRDAERYSQTPMWQDLHRVCAAIHASESARELLGELRKSWDGWDPQDKTHKQLRDRMDQINCLGAPEMDHAEL